jgi:hypothetical protein
VFTIIDWCAKYNILKINIIYYFGWIMSKLMVVISDRNYRNYVIVRFISINENESLSHLFSFILGS